MNDSWVTTDVFIAASICYLVDGFDSLTQVTMRKDARGIQTAHFTLDAPSCDCELTSQEFLSGQLAISDLMAWTKIYNKFVTVLKTMRKYGETEWCSPSWVRGRG